jgi:hypothetical protein
MADKTYGKFFTTAHLSPEQTSALKELLINRQLAGLDAGISAMSGENDPAKRQEQLDQVKSAQAAVDEQIKQLLGPETYSQFQDYDKTQTERMTISAFKDQLPPGAGISPTQEEQLVDAMKQERESFKFTMDLSNTANLKGGPATFFTPEKLQQYQQDLERLNQRYVARAKDILSPEQLDAYGKYLVNQQQMGLASMQMSVKFFKAK